MAKEIVVRAFDDGRIEVEAEGFKGEGCKEATAEIERLLGSTSDVQFKAEWWAKNGRAVRETRKKSGVLTDKLCG